MNYQNPELTEQLSRRYVIGLMRGAARTRFTALLHTYPNINQQVVYWEQRLSALTENLQPVDPPKHLWHRIYARLFSTQSNHTHGFDRWHWFGALGSLAAIVLAIVLIQQPLSPVPDAAERIAVIKGEQQQSLWVLDISERSITVSPQQTIPTYSDKDYQLWMLPADGSNPVSLGLLPQTNQTQTLVPPTAFKLADVGGLAVSLEPKGGSTTGLPTGPVLYTTDIAQL